MTRVIVVGGGMVGTRFVEDLLERDQDARFEVTVLGAEEYQPYNRVLLSDLVAGRVAASALTLPPVPDRAPAAPGGGGLTTRRGAEVVAVDRTARVVVTADGDRHAYDRLVLATGSRARIPAVSGLLARTADGTPSLPRGVHALRTLDDAREIVAATLNATSAVVIGGGVLGLEVVTGLARRGVPATIVHAAATLMERHLDSEASAVVEAALADVGVQARLSATTARVLTVGGRVVGLRLTDGTFLPADLVVVACGTIPETGVAVAAGLDVDRGVLVGHDLATLADPQVFAIGDCAQPPEGGLGLIAQGWDQARRLAASFTAPGVDDGDPLRVMTDSPIRQDREIQESRTDVVRVKATGLDVIAMGVCSSQKPVGIGHRVIRLSDTSERRLVEIVVADGRLVGATCIGAGQVAADLTAAYSRGTPMPRDPAQLLLRPVASAPESATSPTKMPDRMTVCRCNGVTKRDIVTCWSQGADSLAGVAAATRATTGCGGCTDVVAGLLDWLRSSDPDGRAEGSSPRNLPPREPDVPTRKHYAHDLETSAG